MSLGIDIENTGVIQTIDTHFAVGVLAALSLLVFWTHRENLARLLKGTEPKFGQKKKDPAK